LFLRYGGYFFIEQFIKQRRLTTIGSANKDDFLVFGKTGIIFDDLVGHEIVEMFGNDLVLILSV